MTEIEIWMESGAGVREGLRLLSKYRPNPYLARMVERHPEKYAGLLRSALQGVQWKKVSGSTTRRLGFREEWPFLGKPECPDELKILASDKITAWREFCRYHEMLFACVSREQCLDVAKKCIFFFTENRKIHSEFSHYKKTGKVLGLHPIFAEKKRREEALSAGPIALMKQRENLKDAIGRLRRQLRDDARPELSADRLARLRSKETLLEEVNRLIEDFESYGRKKQ